MLGFRVKGKGYSGFLYMGYGVPLKGLYRGYIGTTQMVQVLNKRMLAPNLHSNYWHQNPKYPIIGSLDPKP